jgi:malonyl-CoA/methylmalonyl-CoA synthetase
MAVNFVHELRDVCERRRSAPAILHRGRTHSYADLAGLCAGFGARLAAAGVGAGDRVVVFTPDKAVLMVAHLGAMLAGAVSVPLNPAFTREEMRWFLTDSGAAAIVAGPAQRAVVEPLRADLPTLRAVIDQADVLEPFAGRPPSPTVAPDDPCLMIYTSGTTGRPKGAVHTNANLAASLHALADCWRMTPDDAVLNALPLYHVHGLSFALHMPLLTGGRVMVHDKFEPAAALAALKSATVLAAVPSMYYAFLDNLDDLRRDAAGSTMRLFTCGSAPIRAEVLPTLEAALGRPVINRYGMTEAHVITSLPPDGPRPWGSVGLPIAGVELRLADADGRPTAPGQTGAVFIRGPNLFREYRGNPAATAAAFVDGWFDTGDLGRRDQRGFLTLDGRKNDLIITNGYNVYPQVVERAINECPGVRESAVFGVADAKRGESVAAAVVASDPTLDPARVSAFLEDRLVYYQRPRRIVIVPSLPRNALGKVLRRTLRESIAPV